MGLGPKVVVRCFLNSGGCLDKNFAINFFGDSAIQWTGERVPSNEFMEEIRPLGF